MTQVDTFGVYVRHRLEAWGETFALHRDCEYLGHKSKDMLAVLIEHEGEMPPRVTGFKPLELPLLDLQIEDIVADIARWNKERACVLRGYYCGLGRKAFERREVAEGMIRRVLHRPDYRLSKQRFFSIHDCGFAEVRGRLVGLSQAA